MVNGFPKLSQIDFVIYFVNFTKNSGFPMLFLYFFLREPNHNIKDFESCFCNSYEISY